MLDQPPIEQPVKVLMKGAPFFTKDPYGNFVSCEYKHADNKNPNVHTVLLTDGPCKGGTCFKTEEELFTKKP